MKRNAFIKTFLVTGFLLGANFALAQDDMTLNSKSSTTNFEFEPLPTGDFTAAQEKERRAKAATIARRAQERENAKAREHNTRLSKKMSKKEKRRLASMAHNKFKFKARPSRDKVVSDSDF